MHQLLFSLKRTHLRSLAMQRHAIRPFPLTPARFDMLFALRKHVHTWFKQSDLRRLLGYKSATMSRMAKSVEKLGYIEREVYPFDRRERLIRLTKEGAAILSKVEYEIVDYGMIEFSVTCAFAIRWFSKSAVTELYDLEDKLQYARGQLFDPATFHYDFHPDS